MRAEWWVGRRGERLTTDLPLAALQMAFAGRSPPPGVIHHSDRGSPYTSRLSQAALRTGDAVPNMGRKGDWVDHAVVELFFSTLKRELLLDHVFHTRQEGRSQVFESLEVCTTGSDAIPRWTTKPC
jgi:putative transposase